MGGFEPVAKPWNVADSRRLRVPAAARGLGPVRDADDQRDPPHAVPRDAEIKMLLNGPESFTADGNFILGEAPEVRNYFVCAASTRRASRTRAADGRLVASGSRGRGAARPVGRRHPPLRAVPRNRRHLADRTVESLGLHYAMRWPREELASVRRCAARRSTTACAAKGAVFGTKLNWERANYFRPPAQPRPPHTTLDTPAWLPWVLEEQRAPRGRRRLRPDVVREIRAEGPRRARGAAAPVRQRDRRARRAHGLTAMLNARRLRERPHHHPPRARTRSSSSPARPATRDAAWIERHIERRVRGARRRHRAPITW